MDPTTVQLYLSFGGEKEEENVSVLIGKGLPIHPELWSNPVSSQIESIDPKVPSIMWHVRSRPELSVSYL